MSIFQNFFGHTSSDKAKMMQGFTQSNLISSFANFSNIMDIQNSKMSNAQKKMNTADTGLNALGDVTNMFLPGVGTGLKALNALGGSFIKTPKALSGYQSNQNVLGSSAFSGTANKANTTESNINTFKGAGLAGKLFGRDATTSQMKRSQAEQKLASGVIDESTQAKSNMSSSMNMFADRTKMKQNRIDFNSLRMGKNGMVLKKALKSFKRGGSLSKSVIVDGALHARKHKLKDLKPFKDAEITHKGIPVITKMEDGNVVQHAEIERQELVLNKELTRTLESLFAINDEESMIEAGKIFAKELLKNTKDKSGLIKNSK